MKWQTETLFGRATIAFRDIPGVIRLGTGFKIARESLTRVRALRVIVARKKPLSELPLGERIPSHFEGVPTDVCEPLSTTPIADALGPLQGGSVHNSSRGFEGTIGCFATKLIDNVPTTVLLTAGHTLVDSPGEFGPGGKVGSPNINCCCCCETGRVGEILGGVINDVLDCGIAKLVGNRPPQQLIPGLGPDKDGRNTDWITGIAPLRSDSSTGVQVPVNLGDTVRKVGSRTGPTEGLVVAVDFNDGIPGFQGLPPMVHQIIIRPTENGGKLLKDGKIHFADFGDSGAMLMDDENRVAGMVIRKADLSGKGYPAWTGFGGVATDIHRIISHLNITIFPTDDPPTMQPARFIRPAMAVHREPEPTDEQRELLRVIEGFKQTLEQFPLGERFCRFLERHLEEMVDLANHHRKVTVAWQRARGPGFIVLFLRSLQGDGCAIPKRNEDVDLLVGLESVLDAISEQCTDELREELDVLRSPLRAALSSSDTFPRLLQTLREDAVHA